MSSAPARWLGRSQAAVRPRGTLVDSAPDLAGAANELRVAHGLTPLAFERLRPMVGTGARGMLDAAFGIGPGDPRFDTLRADFLNRYEARILRETKVFARMEPVLQVLEQRGLRWGIVTNKVARLSVPLVDGLGLAPRCAVLISGDSTPHAKPHPAPLLEAARRLELRPEDCVHRRRPPRHRGRPRCPHAHAGGGLGLPGPRRVGARLERGRVTRSPTSS